ncbi:MAG TPA: cobalamin B12-binding domain-containing protein, partial [Nitrospinota bacterium]|nr:cobalamin B12-binding domain-containing protein [Nitrospinota bacterium]
MNNRLALISLYNINNLGVRYLISYLKNKGFEVSRIFFKEMFTNDAQKATKKEKSILIDILKKIDPGIVGISVSCSALLKTATAITHEVHDVLDIPVIWGGAHSIIMPEESIQIADFVCAGEGEI